MIYQSGELMMNDDGFFIGGYSIHVITFMFQKVRSFDLFLRPWPMASQKDRSKIYLLRSKIYILGIFILGKIYHSTKKGYFLPGAIYRHPVTPCRWLNQRDNIIYNLFVGLL